MRDTALRSSGRTLNRAARRPVDHEMRQDRGSKSNPRWLFDGNPKSAPQFATKSCGVANICAASADGWQCCDKQGLRAPAIGHTSSCLFGMVNWLLNEITAEQLGAGTTLEVYIAVPPALE